MKANRARRYDLGEIRQASRTPQGFLKVPGFATRTGVFPYMGADGKVRYELRHPEDVFDPESMETLKNAPVTIEHPPEMITPENVDEYAVGHTTDRVEQIDDKLDTDSIIQSNKGIAAIEDDGIRELSCGYDADIVEEKGVFNGAPYDFRQKNIRYNHLALVQRGRAGPEIRLRLDSADAIMSLPAANVVSQEAATDSEENAIGEPANKKIVISGQEVDLPSDVADTVQDLLDRFDEMRAKISILEESMGKKVVKKDADISQGGVSPQVKVEQQTPDGRSAGAKSDADEEKEDGEEEKEDGEGEAEQGDKGKEDADGEEKEDGEEEKEDGEGEEKKDFDAAAGTGAGGAASSSVDRMKADLDEIRKSYKDASPEAKAKMDSLEGKLDAFAAKSFGKNEKRGDSKRPVAKFTQEQVRARVRLERQAERLVTSETAQKFDSMSDDQIRAAAIKHSNPNAELKGKSTTYLEARFDSLSESFEEESSSEVRRDAGRRMLGLGADGEERMDGEDSDPSQARLRMVKSGREEHKQPLSASKK